MISPKFNYVDRPSGIEAQIVTVAKSGGEFTTIQSAIDSITDSSSTKPYTVLVYPGKYTETAIIEKDYVDLVGVSRGSVIIDGAVGLVSLTGGSGEYNIKVANLTILNVLAGWDIGGAGITGKFTIESVTTFKHPGGQMYFHSANGTIDAKIYDIDIRSSDYGLYCSDNCVIEVYGGSIVVDDSQGAVAYTQASVECRGTNSQITLYAVKIVLSRTNGASSGDASYCLRVQNASATNEITCVGCNISGTRTNDGNAFSTVNCYNVGTMNLINCYISGSATGTYYDLNQSSGGIINDYGSQYQTKTGTINRPSRFGAGRGHHIVNFANDISGTTLTNIPAAVTELSTGGALRTKVDLTSYDEARIIADVTTVASSSGKLRVQCSTGESSWIFLDNSSGPSVDISSTGTQVGAWTALSSTAQADVFLRVVSQDGDGVADPAFGMVQLQVR